MAGIHRIRRFAIGIGVVLLGLGQLGLATAAGCGMIVGP